MVERKTSVGAIDGMWFDGKKMTGERNHASAERGKESMGYTKCFHQDMSREKEARYVREGFA